LKYEDIAVCENRKQMEASFHKNAGHPKRPSETRSKQVFFVEL
jgi:hypothetical protein